MSRTRHLALVGSTASGKSDVAVEVALALGDVEILSVDAMSIYRGMDLGTAKPSTADRARVPHHLIDIADPTDTFSVAQFQEVATAAIADVERRGRRALLVGGTGLYLRAVVDALQMPPEYPAIRAELEAEPSPARLHARLAALDPVAAGRIEPSNRRRTVRALEVTLGAGRPFSSFGPGLAHHRPTSFRMVGIWLPRPVVAARIESRFARLMEAGFLDEVRRLADLDPPLARTAGQALGYRELLEHLAGASTADDAVALAVARTKAFARRQRVWFRRDPRITWVGAPSNPLAAVPALVGDWSRP